MKNYDDFIKLLNSFSSEIAYKILNLYMVKGGLNLTETAREIHEKTSTVRDHLNRLTETQLIYKKNKKYYLSNFGSFILKYLKNLEIFNRTRMVFGQIPAELIPSEFIQELVPFISDIEVQSDQWKFMNISNKIMSQIKEDIGKKDLELKVIGWNSLSLSLEILNNFLGTSAADEKALNRFLKNMNFYLITDKEILKDIAENPILTKIIRNIKLKERIRICDAVEIFEFTLFKYKNIVQFFLNEKGKLGVGHHFILENKPEAVRFFDNVFNYYYNLSKPLIKYLEK
ncbi:MAG: hypothetical protein ACTSPW_05580 [Promethearchaeota archaeon]